MAIKGSVAKENLIKRFADAVGGDYIGEKDKKFYFWSNENGERVQVALALTVPKTPIECGNMTTSTEDKEMDFKPVEMGEDEKATLNRLMEELGL